MAIQNPVVGDLVLGDQGVQNPPSVTDLKTPTGWTATWGMLGVYVGPSSPGDGVVYEAWLAGAPGYWGWIQT